jgi:anti-sigma-K factor RskA
MMQFGRNVIAAAAVVVLVLILASLPSLRADAQQPRLARVSLSSLTAQGFEIKAVTGNQAGTASTLVLQREKDVFLCASRDLSIDPTSFECWPVK